MATVKDIDYLFISTRIRTLEARLLTSERMARMLDAATSEDAAKTILECGYPEITPLTPQNIQAALLSEQQRVVADLAALSPNPDLVDVFRVKYDYHNVKVLLKAEATAQNAQHLLADMGRVPVKELQEKMTASDLRGLPTLLQSAITSARETLGTTGDPQLADLALDKAYYEEMLLLSKHTDSAFLDGYIRISIDAANLRTAVRTIRMGKNAEFLRDTLIPSGNMDLPRFLAAASAGGSLAELFALSPLKQAAEAGVAALKGGRLTQFEKLCDNAVTEYLGKAKYVPFGEAPIIAYLAAKENELTAIRIILTGRLANLPAETIKERLRDSYV